MQYISYFDLLENLYIEYIITNIKTTGLKTILQMKDMIAPIIPNVTFNIAPSSLKTPDIKNNTINIQNTVLIIFFIILPPNSFSLRQS